MMCLTLQCVQASCNRADKPGKADGAPRQQQTERPFKLWSMQESATTPSAKRGSQE